MDTVVTIMLYLAYPKNFLSGTMFYIYRSVHIVLWVLGQHSELHKRYIYRIKTIKKKQEQYKECTLRYIMKIKKT